jgi:hypothetical protein
VEAAGIEPETPISESDAGTGLTEFTADASALCLQHDGIACQSVASLDHELERVIELWPSLHAETRKTIYAICIDAILFRDQ